MNKICIRFLWRIAFSAALFTGVSGAVSAQEPATIRIRFANGKTGKPLLLKSYEKGLATTLSGGYKVDRVDGDSLVVSFEGVSSFAFRGAEFEPCDTQTKKSQPPKYDLHEVVLKGVVAPNYCGPSKAPPKPGELLIYCRREHWWEVSRRIATGLLICA